MKVYQRQLLPKYFQKEFEGDVFCKKELSMKQKSNLRKNGVSHVFYWWFYNTTGECFEGYALLKKGGMWYAQSLFAYGEDDTPQFTKVPTAYMNHKGKTLEQVKKTFNVEFDYDEFAIGINYLIGWAERQFKMS